MCISKRIIWIISKIHRENLFFLHIFAIRSSSRHEKHCRMLVRLFCLFQCSRKPQCKWKLVYFYQSETLDIMKRIKFWWVKRFVSLNPGSQLENRNQVCAWRLKTRSRTMVLYKAIYALGGSSCAVLALNGRPYWGLCQ